MTENSYRRLYRSRTNRKVAGVLGGVGEYAAVDPTALRVLFLLLAVVTGGVSLLAYPLMWLVMPEPPLAPLATPVGTPGFAPGEAPSAAPAPPFATTA
jgi:phage shock protein C